MDIFLHTYVRMFFLLAPFFGVSMFLKMSEGMGRPERRSAAMRCSMTVLIAIFVFFFFGRPLFLIMGITLAAFQIGAGTTLFISSILLTLGISRREIPPSKSGNAQEDDFAVVPLAMPIIVGPGTIGTLLVWGTELSGWANRSLTCAAMLTAAITLSIFLLLAEQIERLMGQKLLAIMTKVTALVLTALAAQIIFTGIKGMMSDGPVM